MDAAIRASPYEAGLYFVLPEPGTTLQSIGTTEWNVGQRYKLQKVLGYGSFSCVCLAIDTITGERVALKRIGDVLHSGDQAKRVLREISILRRTSHPNLIGLRDCFLRPSSTGQCRMINGKLVNCSIDLYIAMEFADGGDLFHMRGQLAPAEVTSLLWQLLHAVQYLHSLHIWHRDVKSQNAFIHWEKGVRVVKLGDFGSARSALQFDLDLEPLKRNGSFKGGGRHDNNTKKTFPLDHQQQQQPREGNRLRPVSTAERSFKQMDEAMMTEDLYANIGEGSTDIDDSSIKSAPAGAGSDEDLSSYNNTGAQKQQQQQGLDLGLANMAHSKSSQGRGFKAPLTRVVATPCYRAPEVVMSRGGYTSALDMWGIGCIFGELLQRVAYIGSASNPNLAVAPLFALRCFPKTPETGETFGRPECSGTRRELQALFDVVGTPSWRDAAAVEMEEWRRYLERLPGKAPTLYRRFKAAGEVPVHLLTRLLDFDPIGRATCEEALAHEFFAAIREELSKEIQIHADAEMEIEKNANEEKDDDINQDGDGDVVLIEGNESIDRTTGDILTANMRVLSFDGPGLGETLSVDAAAAAATLEALNQSSSVEITLLMARNNSTGGGAAGGGVNVSISNTNVVTMEEEENNPTSDSTSGMPTSSASGSASGGGDNNEPLLLPGVVGPPITTAATTTDASSLSNPGEALALLEEELELISAESAPGGVLDPASQGYQRLRHLLEAEVAAAAASAAAHTATRTAATSNATTILEKGRRNGSFNNANAATRTGGAKATSQGGQRGVVGGGGGGINSGPAKIDMAALGPRGASLDYGKERLSNVADTVQGRELDPNKFLGSKRHGEWTAQGGGGSVAPGPRWGVSSMPPGLNAEDPRMKEIIKKQQGR